MGVGGWGGGGREGGVGGREQNIEKDNEYIREAIRYKSIFLFIVTWHTRDTPKNINANIKSRVET